MITDAAVVSCWNSNASTWTRHVRAGYDTYRRLYLGPAFVEFVGDLSGCVTLDAGCGEGTNTRVFAELGATVVGVDISAEMIRAAAEVETKDPLGIRYLTAAVGRLPCRACQFEVCLSTMALRDCVDYPAAVREVYRVLKPGGLFAFSLCHPCFTYDVREWDCDEEGQCVGIRLGDYFDTGAYEEQWRFGAAPAEEQRATEPFTVIYFQRTLSEILNPLCEVGFRLEALHEPRPTEAACAEEPRLAKHRVIPHALFVKARKPGDL